MSIKERGFAMITGASSGIGALYADRLARRGHDLVLVARNLNRLNAVADRVRRDTGRAVEILPADLNDRGELAKIETVMRDDRRIVTLVNNAGVGATAPLLASDVDKMSAMVALNVDALMRLTYAAAPRMVAQGGGTIINIASVVGITPEVLNGVYGGTKAFVIAFSQSLHHELAAQGIKVQAVLPGATRTDFWAAAGADLGQLPREIVMQAEDLVDAALSGLDQGELITIPSLPEVAAWQAYEQARQAMAADLSRSEPAPRYRAPQAA